MRRIQRSGWDRASSCYERYWGAQVRPAVEAVLAIAALQPGEHVVDVACGTGLVTLPAAMQVRPHGRVLATDLPVRVVDGDRTLGVVHRDDVLALLGAGPR